jgi:triacylglycerol lipase
MGAIAGIRRGGHLRDVAAHLRTRGIWAYAPNVSPYDTVSSRCQSWVERLQHILAETGATKLNLIAHSMGGLDARHLISHHDYHRHVASLITISTPHHGSSLANFILEQPDRVRNLITDFANWVGTAIVVGGEADFQRALTELTPENIETNFNPTTLDHEDVKYWSFSGAAGKGTDCAVNPFLRIFNSYMFEREGVNDGMVSAASGHWGEFLGTLDADHAQQVGFAFPGSSSFDQLAFFTDLVVRLRTAGF